MYEQLELDLSTQEWPKTLLSPWNHTFYNDNNLDPREIKWHGNKRSSRGIILNEDKGIKWLTCFKCRHFKWASYFSNDKRSKLGKYSYCQECCKKMRK